MLNIRIKLKKTIYLAILVALALSLVFHKKEMSKWGGVTPELDGSSINIGRKLLDENSFVPTDVDSRIKASELTYGYTSSNDLYALALELLNYAERGDAKAQFWLANTLMNCMNSFVYRDPKMMAMNYDYSLKLQIWERLANRCIHFSDDKIEFFGNPLDWLERSADLEYSPAVIAKMILNDNLEPNLINQALFEKAIESPNYVVTELVAELASNPIKSASWKLLSCRLGMDCSANSESRWVLEMLSACEENLIPEEYCQSGVSMTVYLKSRFPSHFLDIKNRSNFIFDKIQEGRLSDISLEKILN